MGVFLAVKNGMIEESEKTEALLMAELLKDIYTEAFLTTFSQQVQEVYRPFKAQQFVRAVLADNWADLTLKQRTRQIAIVLGQFLPQDYSEAIALLEQLAPDCQGFAYLFSRISLLFMAHVPMIGRFQCTHLRFLPNNLQRSSPFGLLF